MKGGHRERAERLALGRILIEFFVLCSARPAPEEHSFQNQVRIAERGAAVKAGSICSARGCGDAISIMGKARNPSSQTLLRRSVDKEGGKRLIGGRVQGCMLGSGANGGC